MIWISVKERRPAESGYYYWKGRGHYGGRAYYCTDLQGFEFDSDVPVNKVDESNLRWLDEEVEARPVSLEPVEHRVCSVENEDFIFRAFLPVKPDGSPYELYVAGLNRLSIQAIHKRRNYSEELWEDLYWMRAVLLGRASAAPEIGTVNEPFLRAFLQHLTDKGWL